MAGPLLEFETEMFLSLFGCDGLMVVAEGMGIDRILLQFMRVYSEPGSLVLLLNTSTAEQVGAALELRVVFGVSCALKQRERGSRCVRGLIEFTDMKY